MAALVGVGGLRTGLSEGRNGRAPPSAHSNSVATGAQIHVQVSPAPHSDLPPEPTGGHGDGIHGFIQPPGHSTCISMHGSLADLEPPTRGPDPRHPRLRGRPMRPISEDGSDSSSCRNEDLRAAALARLRYSIFS